MAITNIQEKWLESHPIIAYAQKKGFAINVSATIIITLLIIWFYVLNRMKNNLIKQNDTNLKKLISQSRHVVMGEMIAMLTHQWKQPLTTLLLKTGILRDKIKMTNLAKTEQIFLIERLNEMESVIEHQNQTIRDFRDFFRPDKDNKWYDLGKATKAAIEVLGGLFTNNNISIKIMIDNNLKVYGYERDFHHVLINIIKNSVDQIIDKKISNPFVTIRANSKDSIVRIVIEDNAKGIDPSIIKTVFEPYVSTKKLNGTGLGLYISKKIVQESLKGSISAENTRYGARFLIELPKQGGKKIEKITTRANLGLKLVFLVKYID